MRKKNPPASCDLWLTSEEIAETHGVSVSTAHRWKKEAGIPMQRGGFGGMQRASSGLWGMVSGEDWAKGCAHVGKLLGVTRQAAHLMRRRIETYEKMGLRSVSDCMPPPQGGISGGGSRQGLS